MIFREDYIQALEPYIDKPIVKILCGIRRCGKSTIFEMLKETLSGMGVSDEQIIQRRYTQMGLALDRSKEGMYADLKKSLPDGKKGYLLLDEVQEIDGWEEVVNSLLEDSDTDIYVTGSNSKLMSSEISTYLTGRYVTIPVYTLSFEEYLKFNETGSLSEAALLERYIKMGAFPFISANLFDERSAYQIVNDIYNTVVSRDIVTRHKISKPDLFDRVVRYIIENVGQTFSATSVSKFLKSENRTISVETVYNYIKWLCDAFIIYPCRRYDLQGKGVLKTQEKYYLADISLKYSLLGYNRKMLPGILENIVFLEMKRRGYDVYVGKNNSAEIDFVGIRYDERIYVQVCVQLPDGSAREVANLEKTGDHYSKYVVTMNRLDCGNENGIRIVYLSDFLLAKQW